MSKVIHNIILKLRHGSEELDPYSLNSLLSKIKKGFKKTLGFFDFRLWRSGTFGFGLNKFIRFSGTFAVVILLVITALAVCPVIIKTNVAEGTMGTAKASTSTITISSGESADLTVSTVSSTGIFTAGADADMATFTVTTDNYTGYTLNVSGSDDNGLLTNTEASASISSLAAATDASTFANGSADTYSNKWGYQANILNTATSQYTPLMSGNYQPAPTTTATAINTTACANGSTSCPNSVDTYGIRLGARLDYTKPTGTYTNTFILTAVANDVAYTITYADNTNDSTVTGSPINPAATTAGSVAGGAASNATLSSGTPTRTGYTFRAWCLGTATHTAGANSTCSGTEFSAGANFGIDQTIDNTDITLYALWDVNTYNVTVNFAGSGVSSVVFTATGQTTRTVSTSGGTANLAYGVQYTATMNFTSTSYTFDSWSLNNSSYGTMTSSTTNPMYFVPNTSSGSAVISATGKSAALYMQNLAASECTTTPKTVYDSRDNQEYIIQRLADGKCWMMTNLDLNTTTANLTSANTNCYTNGNTDCIASGLSNATLNINTFNAWKKTSGTGTYTAAELIAVSGTDTSSGGPGTPYGTLYNYCAASAGTICTSSDSSNASYDICPAGWRLPTGGSSGEFQTLYNNASYNTNANMRKSYTQGGAAFALAGNFDYSTPTSQGSNGIYWSSTRYNSTSMYGLGLNTSGVYLANTGGRLGGRSIRCVLNETMQDFSSADAAAMSVGDTRTLTDTRDGNSYTIRKLPDNNVWMVQNLRYMGDTVGSSSTSTTWYLKSATSNVSADKEMTMTDLTYGNSNDAARFHNSGNTTNGVWYNYAAASAMTITGSSNSTNASQDICPKNWRLPTDSEQSGITSYKDAFSPVTGGFYSGGSVGSTGLGYWWSATSDGSTTRPVLNYNGSSLGTGLGLRNYGLYVRCIRST